MPDSPEKKPALLHFAAAILGGMATYFVLKNENIPDLQRTIQAGLLGLFTTLEVVVGSIQVGQNTNLE